MLVLLYPLFLSISGHLHFTASSHVAVPQRLPMRPKTGFLGAGRGAGGGEEVEAGEEAEEAEGAGAGAGVAVPGGWRDRSSLKTESI